ncbi:MAG: class I SAM-dependent methyltransferase [Candidatus Dormibacteraeota bacterium]|nr:class I SAM-dependent methyltransferase [Candidatus Dormibacteraeota bacterium]
MATKVDTGPDSGPAEAASRGALPHGVHLVGSVPLGSAEEVFRTVVGALGDRLRRIPDGETGPRSDWIVWQYPVLSSRPQFEVVPPATDHYRALPRLRLREGERAESIRFEQLGYAEAAISSYRLFATLKRDGVIPGGCRFQVSLPTPLAPISAFISTDNQAALEPIYEARMLEELREILAAIPHEQLAIQWDTNFEFGMLEGVFPVWFSDVRGGILERLLRLSRHVPPEVELGYHLCYGDVEHKHFKEPDDSRRLVQIASALSSSLDRPLNWIHMPVPKDRYDDAFFAPLGDLRLRPETELYLGLVHLSDGVEGSRRRIQAARRFVNEFGVATECGWGRRAPQAVPELLEIHRTVSAPLGPRPGDAGAAFQWPAGFVRIPDDEWTRQPVDTFGLSYDTVEHHGWYSNLDPTVAELAQLLRDGDILVDYGGGTGILVDRLKLRVFDRQVGLLIVDSGAKFLRVSLEKFRDDPRVGLRRLHFLRDEKRLQYLDEVLGPAMLERGADVIVSTNAIHLFDDLPNTLASWVRSLKHGGAVLINSGNIRNPRARPNEWILDETVWVINEVAEGLVRTDPRYAAYRGVLDDTEKLEQYHIHRDRVFFPPRPLQYYTDLLEEAGLRVERVREETIEASVDDWFELMGTTYHEHVLGWVGGTERIEGRPPTEEAVKDRLALIRHSMELLFGGRKDFRACWTYITCKRS